MPILLITIVTFALALAFSPTSQAENDLPESGENNVWYTYNKSDTVFVFVHGVLSDSRSTWAYEDEDDPSRNTNWPRLIHGDPKFSDPSIFLGGFHTEMDSSDYGMRDAANELFRALAISIDPANEAVLDKPNIIFITHSTGGIVVRHMLYRETAAFADKKVGLVLIASPSIGSRDAGRLSLIAKVAKHRLGQELQWNHPFLEELDSDFKNLVNDRRLPGLIGTEWIEHHLIGGKIGRAIGWARGEVLVEKASAARYFGEPIRLQGTDHFSAVKPDSRRHPAYENLRFFYEREFLPAAHPADKQTSDGITKIIDNRGVAAGGNISVGGDITISSTASEDETASEPLATARTRGIEFALYDCAKKGADVSCSLNATSTQGTPNLLIKAKSRYGYLTDVQSALFDQASHEFALSEAKIGDLVYTPKFHNGYANIHANRFDITKQLIEGAPTKVRISFKDAASKVELIKKLTIGGAIDGESFMIEFPDIKLTAE